jgi:hypothetical protein
MVDGEKIEDKEDTIPLEAKEDEGGTLDDHSTISSDKDESSDAPSPGYVVSERKLLNEEEGGDSERTAQTLDAVEESTPDDEDSETSREGFAIYEPTPAAEEVEVPLPSGGREPALDEWVALSSEVYVRYGDTLAGPAGYMGPVGGLLVAIGAAVIGLRVGIGAAERVISPYMLMIAAGAFIIGFFLLVFHFFHWLSNRSKGVALSRESKRMMLIDTCEFLDIRVGKDGMKLRCQLFKQEISEAPECVVCKRYTPKANDHDVKPGVCIQISASGEKQNGEGSGEGLAGNGDRNQVTFAWKEPKGDE